MIVAERYEIEILVPKEHAIGGSDYWHRLDGAMFSTRELAKEAYEIALNNHDGPLRLVRIETHSIAASTGKEGWRESFAN